MVYVNPDHFRQVKLFVFFLHKISEFNARILGSVALTGTMIKLQNTAHSKPTALKKLDLHQNN